MSSGSEAEASDDSDDDGFEDQGSDSDSAGGSASGSDSEPELAVVALPDSSDLEPPRLWSRKVSGLSHRTAVLSREVETTRDLAVRGHTQELLQVDDLSSDDEAGGNAIGKVPLHWYDEYEHLGYRNDGSRVERPEGGNAIDQVLEQTDDPNAK